MVNQGDHGHKYITVSSSATAPFTNSHGIKQGCCLSPALFSILLSPPHAHDAHIRPHTFPTFSYADNIILLGHSPAVLATSHAIAETICTDLSLIASPT